MRFLLSIALLKFLTFPIAIALQLQIDMFVRGLEDCVGSHGVA